MADFLRSVLAAEHAQWDTDLRARAGVAASAEFEHPFPAEPDGLPGGWVIRWYLPYKGLHFFLVERQYGGWCALIHSTTKETSLAGPVDETLWGLYAQTAEVAGEGEPVALTDLTGPVARLNHPIEAVVRDYALSFYDDTDPAEATEAARVRPGGRLALLPRALPHR